MISELRPDCPRRIICTVWTCFRQDDHTARMMVQFSVFWMIGKFNIWHVDWGLPLEIPFVVRELRTNLDVNGVPYTLKHYDILIWKNCYSWMYLCNSNAKGTPIQNSLKDCIDVVHDNHRQAAIQNAIWCSTWIALPCTLWDFSLPLRRKLWPLATTYRLSAFR